MDKMTEINEVFNMLGLGTDAERNKYKFEALYGSSDESTNLKVSIVGNTEEIRKDGALINAQLEYHFK